MQLKQSLFGCVVRLRCLAALFGSVVQLPGRRHIKSELPVLLAVPAGAGERAALQRPAGPRAVPPPGSGAPPREPSKVAGVDQVPGCGADLTWGQELADSSW